MQRTPTHRTRTLDRRAARARRSKWLSRVLFSVMGAGLLLFMRLNPAAMADIVAWAHNTNRGTQHSMLSHPVAIDVRAMPRDVVPVRRGTALPGHGTHAPADDTQAQTSASADTLRARKPGG